MKITKEYCRPVVVMGLLSIVMLLAGGADRVEGWTPPLSSSRSRRRVIGLLLSSTSSHHVVESSKGNGIGQMSSKQSPSSPPRLSLEISVVESTVNAMLSPNIGGFLLPIVLSSLLVFSTGLSTSWAAEQADASSPATSLTKQQHSIEKCSVATTAPPCVSTGNVRQLDLYAPPWTFATLSTDEAMSRLKGAITYDTSLQIVQQDGSEYLLVEAKRDMFGNTDRLEFVINGPEEVITFRSQTTAESDVGNQQRRRLDQIRKRVGVFGVMGESLNSADTATAGERGNGPLGQLKAFYGLQSGSGFEDVLAE